MPAPIQETIQENGSFLEEEAIVPPTKMLDPRDSISSIDSDVSLSYDRKGSLADTQVPENEDEGAHMADLSDSASDTGSAGGGKDSGCEVTPEITEPPFTPPSEELADKICQQVEFYFSDANITKDAFLLKHVKRNKEGYVSLKLISSFKRVKHLTKDWRVVAHALKRSTKLEINEAGTKLRRLDPLPKYDETTPSRTVVAVHMPIDKPTIENVAELFKNCGEIALIRILRPGNPIPADVRQFINKNPSLGGLVCALVEFVNSESARNAMQLQNTLGEPMKVYELNNVPHPERKKKTNNKKTNNNNNNNNNNINNMYNKGFISESDYISSSCQSSSEAEDVRKFDPRAKMRRGSSAFPSRYIEPAAWLQRRLSASSTEANFLYMPRRLSYSSRDSSESSLFLPRRMSACSISSNDSFYNRRMSSVSQTSSSEAYSNRSRSNSSAFQNGENVLRMPKGPDGSKGFCRQRPSLPTVVQ
ncbi:la-related protein 6 [Anthonomus grandis grandis]|uniref:la-related protein 6 n=1 Tax=Anthonomus grandis grandis TaxID=2921223 RepID=UPI002165C56F|nr:la-related protein 6 [Anthonomus grandis grandis]